MLLGYGAYEISIRPSFEAKRAVWFDHGGVIAYAHVRGGGELGREWHQSAVRANKQRSVDDYIACAETLIGRGLTSPSLVAGVGHSAGGLLVGAAMVQRPDLFRAISINSGIVDVLRFLSVGAGPDNADEFGHLTIEEDFRVLHHLDVYQQAQAGVSYPALLVSVGMNDPRVPFWQGAKLVAKVQDTSALKHPAIFVARRDTGHVGASLEQLAETSAVQYGFLLWQLGRGQISDGPHVP